jgi:hypothetical protein
MHPLARRKPEVNMNRAVFVLALLITLPSHALQVSVSPTETLEIAERSAVVKIDGKLDEAVWASLDQYDEFVVIEPDTLVKPCSCNVGEFVL